MADSPNSSRVLIFSIFMIGLLLLIGYVAHNQNQQQIENWRAEAQRQQALTEKAMNDLTARNKTIDELRAEFWRQRSSSESALAELRGEVNRQRTDLDTLRNQRQQQAATQIFDGGLILTEGGLGGQQQIEVRLAPDALMGNNLPGGQRRRGGMRLEGFRGGVAQEGQGRSWGPEQAAGEPNTPNPGDQHTAWASQTPDGQKEWLELDYGEELKMIKVLIHETYNPGAVTKVSVLDAAGKETTVWEGKDPAPAGVGKWVSEITFNEVQKCQRVKIYIDSPAVPGWNEIDAVGVLDEVGKPHWAKKVKASSSFGAPERIEAQPGERPIEGAVEF